MLIERFYRQRQSIIWTNIFSVTNDRYINSEFGAHILVNIMHIVINIVIEIFTPIFDDNNRRSIWSYAAHIEPTIVIP